jgi:nitroimidazol reductase NimA-like FMN-containing flavoprotein (pyridoxamine 5'-phosphate oxidase superfamily)
MDEPMRQKIMSLLEQNRVMTIATVRPDGWPQATTVGFSYEGLTLYFLCGTTSQKALNLARDDRVSITIDHDSLQVMEITGLSMAARATRITDMTEAAHVLDLIMSRYPEQKNLNMPLPSPNEIALFKVTPKVISVLDYSRGFGHADLVECAEP